MMASLVVSRCPVGGKTVMLAVPAVASTERRLDLRAGASFPLRSFKGLMARHSPPSSGLKFCGQGCAKCF